MENIKLAIASAHEAKPLDFKTHIEAELKDRVYSALLSRKQEIASSLFKDASDEETNDITNSEDHVDETV